MRGFSHTLLEEWHSGIEMVPIPSGSFFMGNTGASRDQECWCSGCNCEEPRHPVNIPYIFQMGKYEITNAEYADVLNWARGRGYLRNSSNGPYNGGDVFHNGQIILDINDTDQDITFGGGQFFVENRNNEVQGNHPVNEVSWYGTVAFCNWASEMEGFALCYNLSTWTLVNRDSGGYRLPSESEWEYACRGSAANPNRYAPFSFGDDPSLNLSSCSFSPILDRYMVWCGNDDGWSEAVGTKLANDYGLHDMHGNIWEWCQDSWHESYNGSTRLDDGRAWEDSVGNLRVLRGGGWNGFARNCRSAGRFRTGPVSAGHNGGFRVVRSPQSL